MRRELLGQIARAGRGHHEASREGAAAGTSDAAGGGRDCTTDGPGAGAGNGARGIPEAVEGTGGTEPGIPGAAHRRAEAAHGRKRRGATTPAAAAAGAGVAGHAESTGGVASGAGKRAGDAAQQREQLRTRKENLEQVRRLLEKQEMVVARKLADHNAIRTVAAVGIFVIMVLGGVFLGVYRFVHPLYRSEAVVQLAPPADLQGEDLQKWLNSQSLFMRSKELTDGAWNVLRSPEVRYAMHDVREAWAGSLPERLTLSLDSGSKTLAVKYTGPEAGGVSQVCNALAKAYTDPTARVLNEATHSVGTGSRSAGGGVAAGVSAGGQSA